MQRAVFRGIRRGGNTSIRGNVTVSQIAPTTKAQVSGHKFLVRRMQHALVLGDIRMIHDPLASRRRALIFGLVAVLLIALGSGLLAWLRPDPDPGEATLVRSEQSQLYVRVDDTLHPVANLVSARLILGEAAEPVTIGTSALENSALGTPLGIVDAPIALSTPPELDPLAPPAPTTWAACLAEPSIQEPPFITSATRDAAETDREIVVTVGKELQKIPQPAAAYVTYQDRDWLITQQGRALLPAADSDEGRIIRRVLKLEHAVAVPPEFLNTFAETPPIKIPELDLVRAEQQTWAQVDGGIVEITETQAEILRAAGADITNINPDELAELATVTNAEIDTLPATVPSMISADEWLCANSDGEAATLAPVDGLVELSGDGPARYFTGLTGGAVAVDTGFGVHIIEEAGRRHELPDASLVDALGVAVHEAAWPIVRLLPEATALTSENAHAASY